MQDVQNKAMITYQGNLLYFQENHPELYNKIGLLSQAIEMGQYKENYSLEYKNGYFDVLDLNSGHYLYGASSTDLAKKATDDITFDKTNGVIETFYNFSFDEKAVELAQESDPTESQFVLTAPVVSYVSNLLPKQTSTMKEIYKFIFFGVGLGIHLGEIDKKAKAYMYLVIEDNLEIFRLSLFTTDYVSLANDSELFFSIMDDEATFKNTFDQFYHLSFIRNNYLKYSVFYPEYRKKITDIQNFIITQTSLTYPHNKLLLKNITVLDSIEKEYPFFDISHHYNETPFSSYPVILVAAGPSLVKEIQWLQKNAKHAIIVALFMTLPILEEYGIEAHIVVHIDENMDIINRTIARLKNKQYLQNSYFFLAPSIQCDTFLQLTKKENIYLLEDRTRYRFNKGFLETYSVGELTYTLTLLWDVHELYLLGLDLALDAQTKQTHASGHNSANGKSKLQKADESDSLSLRESELEIKGNFSQTVPTTPLFDMSRRLIDTFGGKYIQTHQKVYNLNHGAYFIHTTPTHAKDVDLTSSQIITETILHKIQKFFTQNASAIMDIDEKEALKERVEDTLKKKQRIQEFAQQKMPTMSQFHNYFSTLGEELIASPSQHFNELAQVYIIYLENIGGYIGDFFNTQNIKNPKKHIKKFQKILISQFLKIADKYLESLEKINKK